MQTIIDQPSKTREQIQKEGLEALLTNNGRGTLNIDTGVGKSKIVIDFINLKEDIIRILITSPRTNLKDSWTKELMKWLQWEIIESSENRLELADPDTGRIIMVDLVNVQTAYKWPESSPETEYDLIVGDEVHTFMTPEYSKVFKIKSKYLICLTATTDIKRKNNKHERYEEFAPIIYIYNTAEEDGVVNDVKIITVNHVLNDYFKTVGGTKAKPFLIGEARNYEYLSAQIKKGQMLMGQQGSTSFFDDANLWFWQGLGTPDQKTAARIYLTAIRKRREMLLNLDSTRAIAKALTVSIYKHRPKSKILVFSEMTKQVDKICVHTYHSNNPEDVNTENLKKFNEGEIRVLGSCYSLTLGLNMSAVDTAIYESYQGSETLAKQRKGRLHRLDKDDQATIYIIRVLGTQMEEWFWKFADKDQIVEEIPSAKIIDKSWIPTIR